MVHEFNETVIMYQKQWTKGTGKTWFLHMIENATCYIASTVIKSKRKEFIAEEKFNIWIKMFGQPKKILIENGGESDK